jgi:hypothetical protein
MDLKVLLYRQKCCIKAALAQKWCLVMKLVTVLHFLTCCSTLALMLKPLTAGVARARRSIQSPDMERAGSLA